MYFRNCQLVRRNLFRNRYDCIKVTFLYRDFIFEYFLFQLHFIKLYTGNNRNAVKKGIPALHRNSIFVEVNILIHILKNACPQLLFYTYFKDMAVIIAHRYLVDKWQVGLSKYLILRNHKKGVIHIPIFFHCIQYFCICICIIPLYFYFLNRKVCKQKIYSQSDNYYKSNQKQEEMSFSWIIVCNQF